MNSPRVVWILAFVMVWCPSVLRAQPSIDSGEKRLAQQRQCRAWLRSALDFRKQGKPADALAALDSVLLCDAKDPDAHYLKSQILTEEGDTSGAIAVLRTGVSQAPLSMRIKVYLARLLLGRDELTEAASLVDAVLVIKPREGEALYLRGLLDLKLGNEQAALDHFELALKHGLKSHAR